MRKVMSPSFRGATAMRTANCPEEARLKEHLEGSLPAGEEVEIVSHLDACAECRHLLETLADAGGPWLTVAGQIGTEPSNPSPTWDAVAAHWSDVGEASVPPERSSPLTLQGLPEQSGQLGRIDHYTLREVIGHGSMGVVFKAFDEKLQRVVARKALSPLWAAKPTARLRFLREARAAAAIRDEHVVVLYAVGESRGRAVPRHGARRGAFPARAARPWRTAVARRDHPDRPGSRLRTGRRPRPRPDSP